MRLAYVVSLFFISLVSLGCKDESLPPPPPNEETQLKLEALDASCTEAWLKVSLPSGIEPRTVRLRRDTVEILTTTLLSTDTTVIDEGLLPSSSYMYAVTRSTTSGEERVTASITTLDTTSHNWAFDLPVLLGDGSSSVLYDVAIVRADPDSMLVLAVGEIYHSDSAQSFLPFSVAIWNGQTWQLKRVYYNGTNIIASIRGIWIVGPNDIWLAAGSVFHWDGVSSQAQLSFSRLDLPDPNATIEKLWGSPSLGLYGVGNAGTIVHRDISGTWRRVESGTELSVYDIFGSRSFVSGELEVYAVAAQQFVTYEKQIMKVTLSGVSVVSASGIPASIHGIWFKGGGPYYVVGSGMYRKLDAVREGLWQPLHNGVTQYYIYAVRGSGVNDIFACGSLGELLHFSGTSWHSYRSTPGFSSIEFYEVACRGSLVVAVGYDQPHAAVVIGRRQ